MTSLAFVGVIYSAHLSTKGGGPVDRPQLVNDLAQVRNDIAAPRPARRVGWLRLILIVLRGFSELRLLRHHRRAA